MGQTILPRPAALRPERRNRNQRSWFQPRRRRAAATARRLLNRLVGIDPDQSVCWCGRCLLYRLNIYRRIHVRYGRSAYLRTSVFGIRIFRDRYAFPLD